MSLKSKVCGFIVFFIIFIGIATVTGVNLFIKPLLLSNEERFLQLSSNEIFNSIDKVLKEVEAIQKSTTSLIPITEDRDIERFLPKLVNQYGNSVIFGGGIWPLPNQRVFGVNKASSFFHRDEFNQLVKNSFWNGKKSPNYYDQSWFLMGLKSKIGQCVWANAYKDDASIEPRTNCAMVIKNSDKTTYGVSTIDVTLGFFNKLVKSEEEKIQADILIIQHDGTILSQSKGLSEQDTIMGNIKNSQSSMAKSLVMAINDSNNKVNFMKNEDEYTLFIQEITGTPWIIAVAKKTELLQKNTTNILKILSLIQIPILLCLLLSLLFLFNKYIYRSIGGGAKPY